MQNDLKGTQEQKQETGEERGASWLRAENDGDLKYCGIRSDGEKGSAHSVSLSAFLHSQLSAGHQNTMG